MYGTREAREKAPQFHPPPNDAKVFRSAGLEAATGAVFLEDPDLDEDPSPREPREVGDSVSVRSYELELGMGDRLDTPEGDSIWLVRYKQGGSSLTWPTDLPPAEFFIKALERIKVSGGIGHSVEIYVPGDPDPAYVEAGKLPKYQHPSNKDPNIVRLEDEDSGVAFGWQLTAFDGTRAEGGIVAPLGMPRQLLEDLLLETGSGTIPSHSHELAARVIDLEK